jgi:hypothetical protein
MSGCSSVGGTVATPFRSSSRACGSPALDRRDHLRSPPTLPIVLSRERRIVLSSTSLDDRQLLLPPSDARIALIAIAGIARGV